MHKCIYDNNQFLSVNGSNKKRTIWTTSLRRFCFSQDLFITDNLQENNHLSHINLNNLFNLIVNWIFFLISKCSSYILVCVFKGINGYNIDKLIRVSSVTFFFNQCRTWSLEVTINALKCKIK